ADGAGSPVQSQADGEPVHGRLVHTHQLLPLVLVEIVDAERGLRVLGHQLLEAGVVVKALQGQYQSALTHVCSPFLFPNHELGRLRVTAIHDGLWLWSLTDHAHYMSKRGATSGF